MYTIAIDVGSSYIKSVVFALSDEKMLLGKTVPTPSRLPLDNPHCCELDAENLFQLIKSIIDGLTTLFPIQNLLFSTQMHGFVYHVAGAKDRYVSWQDTRSTLPLENGQTAVERMNDLFPPDVFRRCGVRPKPSLGICNLYSLLNGDDFPSRDGELFTLGSYLIWRLTGNNVCHSTNAAPLGLMDVVNHRWDEEILYKAGLSTIRLPKIAERDLEICGTYESSGQILSVYPDFGDQQVCILGSDVAENDVVVNIATACQISRISNCFDPRDYEVRPFFNGQFLNTITDMPSGRHLDVIIRFFREIASTLTGIECSNEEVWLMLNQLDGDVSDGLAMDMSFFSQGRGRGSGSITGIQGNNLCIGGLLAAAYDYMTLAYVENIHRLAGCDEIQRLIFCGSVGRKNFPLLRRVSDITGVHCIRTQHENEVLNGLYRLSVVANGRAQSLEESCAFRL